MPQPHKTLFLYDTVNEFFANILSKISFCDIKPICEFGSGDIEKYESFIVAFKNAKDLQKLIGCNIFLWDSDLINAQNCLDNNLLPPYPNKAPWASIETLEEKFSRIKEARNAHRLEKLDPIYKGLTLEEAVKRGVPKNLMAHLLLKRYQKHPPGARGLASESANKAFEGHWVDLYDPEKRIQSAPLAQNCVELLQIEADFGKCNNDSSELEAYWRLYNEEAQCVFDVFNKIENKAGYASRLAVVLCWLGELDKASELIKKEALDEIKDSNQLHLCALATALVGDEKVAKECLKNMDPSHFENPEKDSQKWFYQAYINKVFGDEESMQKCLDKAKTYDPLFLGKKHLIDRTSIHFSV